MDSMITENLLTFKELEQKIFKAVCEIAVMIVVGILQVYDKHLMLTRDKKVYRNKGLRKTTIKTLFGEVTFRRTVYETMDDDGARHYVFLLDEALGLENVGLLSENYAEKLVSGITTKSYRECAKEISETTGQSISAMGVWNVVQELGRKLHREEKILVEQYKKGRLEGKKEVPVIFEESDGVNLKLQGKDRKASKNGIAEVKTAIAYDGWKEESPGRYRLDGKVVFAGIEKSKDFHRIREAKIAKEYNLEEAEYRILNGDGANWIKKVPDKDTLFQLDIFHRNKAIREKIPYKEAQEAIFDYLSERDMEGLFHYLEIYENSLSEEDEIKSAQELTSYFRNNRKGLIPYRERGLKLPQSPEGLVYRDLGAMEANNWNIIAGRMKHGHRTWSKSGANNLCKILAKKSEGKLYEVTKRLELPVFEETKAEVALGELLSAAKAPTHDGNGYEYPVRGSVVAIEEALRGDPKKLFWMAGY